MRRPTPPTRACLHVTDRLPVLILLLGLATILTGHRPYIVNPSLGSSVQAGAITVDGQNSGEWSDANLIAMDVANDDPRSIGDNWTMHETPWDLTHLWAAWDDNALYLAWQYVDVTDQLDPSNQGSAGGTKPNQMDMIQWIALDTAAGAGASLDMWGKNGEAPYWNGTDRPDYQIYIASNLWQGFISHAVDDVFVVDDAAIDYFAIADVGIEAAVENGLAVGELWGVGDADDAGDPDALRDFLAEGHDGGRDTFYEMKIPYAAIGLTRDQLEQGGVGVMLGQGEFSCMDTIPNDPATSDSPGVSDTNSPLEWGDSDLLTVDFARIGQPRSDACVGVECPPGQFCVNGACEGEGPGAEPTPDVGTGEPGRADAAPPTPGQPDGAVNPPPPVTGADAATADPPDPGPNPDAGSMQREQDATPWPDAAPSEVSYDDDDGGCRATPGLPPGSSALWWVVLGGCLVACRRRGQRD